MRPSPTPQNPSHVESENPRLSQRARVGLALLGVLALVWIFTLPRPFVSVGADMPGIPGPPIQRVDLQASLDLQAAALRRQVAVFEPGRNIFAFDSPSRKVKRSIGQDEERQVIPQAEEKPTQPPQDSGLDVSLLGVFGPERLRVAVLKNKAGDNVSNILEQDMIENRYRVLDIDPKSIVLRDTASPDDMMIRLEAP